MAQMGTELGQIGARSFPARLRTEGGAVPRNRDSPAESIEVTMNVLSDHIDVVTEELKSAKRKLYSNQPNQSRARPREFMRIKGLPLSGLGGPGNSEADWASYFRGNPGSQEKAFEAVLEAAQEADVAFGTEIARTGTTLTQAVWKSIVEGKFTSIP